LQSIWNERTLKFAKEIALYVKNHGAQYIFTSMKQSLEAVYRITHTSESQMKATWFAKTADGLRAYRKYLSEIANKDDAGAFLIDTSERGGIRVLEMKDQYDPISQQWVKMKLTLPIDHQLKNTRPDFQSMGERRFSAFTLLKEIAKGDRMEFRLEEGAGILVVVVSEYRPDLGDKEVKTTTMSIDVENKDILGVRQYFHPEHGFPKHEETWRDSPKRRDDGFELTVTPTGQTTLERLQRN